jgi:hypothetical protein
VNVQIQIKYTIMLIEDDLVVLKNKFINKQKRPSVYQNESLRHEHKSDQYRRI